VRDWIRDWDVPDVPATVDPRSAVGAAVTLRLGGRVVGRGSHVLGSEADEIVGRVVWLAAREAQREAAQRLPAPNDALRDEALRDYAQGITIDLQIAGALRPLPREGLVDLAARLSPGLDGVAARVGARVRSVFPGTTLATNATLGEALASSINALDLPAVDAFGRPLTDPDMTLDQLRDAMGLVLYSFRTLHVAHPRPDEPPRFLFRGGSVVDLSSITPGSLEASARRVARHIGSHRWPGGEPFGLLGVYRPWLGDYAPPLVADPTQQGLAAYALARYAGTLEARDESEAARSLRRAAQRIVYELSVVAGEEEPADASLQGAALFTLAATESGALDPFDGDVARERDVVERMRKRCLERLLDWAGGGEGAPPPVQSVAAAALARVGVATGDREAQDAAREQVRRLFRQTDPGAMPALSPWLGWAEIWLAGEGRVPAGVAMRDFRDLVWRHQLTREDAEALEPDLVGGVVFTGAENPLPTWHSLRPVALCATMLGDPRLTDREEVSSQTLRLLVSLRFLEQLIVGDAEMHMFRDRRRSIGGVRLAMWDQRLTLEAASIALLTLSEALDGFSSIASRENREAP